MKKVFRGDEKGKGMRGAVKEIRATSKRDQRISLQQNNCHIYRTKYISLKTNICVHIYATFTKEKYNFSSSTPLKGVHVLPELDDFLEIFQNLPNQENFSVQDFDNKVNYIFSWKYANKTKSSLYPFLNIIITIIIII